MSRLYATAPVGVTDQPEFRNAVVLLDVPPGPDPESGAMDLLVALKAIERQFGRRRGKRWGPRLIDLDLEAFGPWAISVERVPGARSRVPAPAGVSLLIVPHASAQERLFVLAPWSDVAPDQRPPGWDETIAEARDRLVRAEPPDAVHAVAAWDPDAGAWVPERTGLRPLRDES